MRYLFVILLYAGSVSTARSQVMERKLIIQNNDFYFTTIDSEFQVATLHTGKLSEPLNKARQLALPAGRNYDLPVNPFVWDISDSMVYAVNFLKHPLNDRNEALKRFPLSSLQQVDSTVTGMDMLIKSVDQPAFTNNDPYLYIIKRSNVINNFYFDAIALNDSSYYMAISNNGEISIWNYNGKQWTHGEMQKNETDGYFTMFSHNKRPYLLFNNGGFFEVTPGGMAAVITKMHKLGDGIVIINKDNDTVQFLRYSDLSKEIPLSELIKNKAINLF